MSQELSDEGLKALATKLNTIIGKRFVDGTYDGPATHKELLSALKQVRRETAGPLVEIAEEFMSAEWHKVHIGTEMRQLKITMSPSRFEELQQVLTAHRALEGR